MHAAFSIFLSRSCFAKNNTCIPHDEHTGAAAMLLSILFNPIDSSCCLHSASKANILFLKSCQMVHLLQALDRYHDRLCTAQQRNPKYRPEEESALRSEADGSPDSRAPVTNPVACTAGAQFMLIQLKGSRQRAVRSQG